MHNVMHIFANEVFHHYTFLLALLKHMVVIITAWYSSCIVSCPGMSACYVTLRCAVLCCAVLCCAVLCCAVLCCAVLYCTVFYYARCQVEGHSILSLLQRCL